jgi:hypothetical protein
VSMAARQASTRAEEALGPAALTLILGIHRSQ